MLGLKATLFQFRETRLVTVDKKLSAARAALMEGARDKAVPILVDAYKTTMSQINWSWEHYKVTGKQNDMAHEIVAKKIEAIETSLTSNDYGKETIKNICEVLQFIIRDYRAHHNIA